MQLSYKKCPRCQEEKKLDDFHRCCKYNDGRQVYCISCRNKIQKEYKKQRYKNDPIYRENLNNYKKEYIKKRRNGESEEEKMIRRKKHRDWYNKNKNILSDKSSIRRLKNRDKINENAKNRKRERMKIDKNYHIICNLRTRVWFAIKRRGTKKLIKTEELLGCELEFFKIYLENLWEDKMNWDNYGKNGWHIDHIKPCISFDLTQEEEQKKCFHYTNLQPLWATTKIALSHGSNSIGNINKNNHFLES